VSGPSSLTTDQLPSEESHILPSNCRGREANTDIKHALCLEGEGVGIGYRYAKINVMKASLPRPQHDSYLKHRRQAINQIVLPVILAALLIVALAVLIGIATFRGDGDVARWSAISAIWIILPFMFAGLLFLALLGGMIYLMVRLLGILPSYTSLAQEFAYRLKGYIKRFTEISVRPVFAIDEIGTTIKALIGRK